MCFFGIFSDIVNNVAHRDDATDDAGVKVSLFTAIDINLAFFNFKLFFFLQFWD